MLLLSLSIALAGEDVAVSSLQSSLCADEARTTCFRSQPSTEFHAWTVLEQRSVEGEDDAPPVTVLHLQARAARVASPPDTCVDGLPAAWPGVEVYAVPDELVPVALQPVTITIGDTHATLQPGLPLTGEPGAWHPVEHGPLRDDGQPFDLAIDEALLGPVAQHEPKRAAEVLQLSRRPGELKATLHAQHVTFPDVPWMWHLTGYQKKKGKWYLTMADRCLSFRVGVDGKLPHTVVPATDKHRPDDGDTKIPAGTPLTWVGLDQPAGALTEDILVSSVEALTVDGKTCWQRAVGHTPRGFVYAQVCQETP